MTTSASPAVRGAALASSSTLLVEGLIALAYVSTLSAPLTGAVLNDVLTRSRRNNHASGISGVLLHCNGSFMQYLEGPSQAVDATYRRVLADRRHHGVIELLREPIERREFGDWDMAYSGTGRQNFEAILKTPCSGGLGHGASAISKVLLAFWHGNTELRGNAS